MGLEATENEDVILEKLSAFVGPEGKELHEIEENNRGMINEDS